MNILPFAQPRARTSPQHDSASVEVKHTDTAREPGADWFREARIRVLSRSYVAAMLADDRAGKVDLWDDLSASITGRSPTQVQRMEVRLGLR